MNEGSVMRKLLNCYIYNRLIEFVKTRRRWKERDIFVQAWSHPTYCQCVTCFRNQFGPRVRIFATTCDVAGSTWYCNKAVKSSSGSKNAKNFPIVRTKDIKVNSKNTYVARPKMVRQTADTTNFVIPDCRTSPNSESVQIVGQFENHLKFWW